MKYDRTTHGDFKNYYDTDIKRHYWILGYFGGGSINIIDALELAKEYSLHHNVPLEEIYIDEILHSCRYKHFKFISSNVEQEPSLDAYQTDKVWQWLTD